MSPTLVRLKLMRGSLYRSSYLTNVGSMTTTGAGTLERHNRRTQVPIRYCGLAVPYEYCKPISCELLCSGVGLLAY